jgi:hypothetical protein
MRNEVDSSSNQNLESPQSPHRTEVWQFVVNNDPQAAKSEQSRRRVRSHAMRHYHQRVRSLVTRGIRPLRQRELELDVTPLLESSIRNPIGMATREDELFGHRKMDDTKRGLFDHYSSRSYMHYVPDDARHRLPRSSTTNCSFPSATGHVIVASGTSQSNLFGERASAILLVGNSGVADANQ